MPYLELRNLRYAYDGIHPVLDDLSFTLEKGALACLLGPSGCGKTTALRCIAGFEQISQGEIVLNGQVVASRDVYVPTEQRRIGMVFQDYALFPHLSVAQNIAFGLYRRSAAERRARVAQLLEVVRLKELRNAYPHELSGGQQQRVALARVLAPEPQLILLDEPFSNLDQDLRERLSLEVHQILKASGITAVLVTHEQHEAFAMADQIGVMFDGHIHQWDTAYNLYHRPVNRLVADFVGEGVFLPGKVLSLRQVQIELGILDGKIPAECIAGCSQGCIVDVLLRPDDIIHDDASDMKAEVVAKAFRGAEFLYTLRLGSGATVLSLVPSHHNHAVGEHIGIRLDADHVVAFHNENEHMIGHKKGAPRNLTDTQRDNVLSATTPLVYSI